MSKKLFDSVQVGVSNQSTNKRMVNIRYHKMFQYYTKGKLNGKNPTARVSFFLSGASTVYSVLAR